MKLILKKIILLLLILIIIILFLRAGHFYDVTKEPVKSDIIVSLGGDNGNRIRKTLDLYQLGYSSSNKIILTGIDNFDPEMSVYELDWRIHYLDKKGVSEDNIVTNFNAKNSLEEIKYIRDYLVKNDFSSVIFISDPTHSKRLNFFIDDIYSYNEYDLTYVLVASDAKWWDKSKYFLNQDAIIFVFNETIKLTYYYFRYILGGLDE